MELQISNTKKNDCKVTILKSIYVVNGLCYNALPTFGFGPRFLFLTRFCLGSWGPTSVWNVKLLKSFDTCTDLHHQCAYLWLQSFYFPQVPPTDQWPIKGIKKELI